MISRAWNLIAWIILPFWVVITFFAWPFTYILLDVSWVDSVNYGATKMGV